MSDILEHPILFSAPMVRALIEGRQTQTRRVMKRQPYTLRTEGWGFPTRKGGFVSQRMILHDCPYGKPGDRLWVREAWQTGNKLDKSNATEIRNSCLDAGWSKPGAPIKYGADERITVWGDNDAEHFGPWGRKRSSRFMPRWASRITLEITEVRVQRLQEISEEDALAEGVTCWVCGGPTDGTSENDCDCFHRKNSRDSFNSLWNSINGEGSWDANPWVWAVSFKVVA